MTTEDAIKKINNEMQKNPGDAYLEAIGHYVIDRCYIPEVQNAVGNGVTLKSAMQKVLDKAKRQKRGNVAVLTDEEVFSIVAKCFGIKYEEKPQQIPISEPKQTTGIINLEFDDLF